MSLINIIKAVGRILADKLLTMINAVVMPIVAAFSAVDKSVATGFAAVRKSVITGFAAVIAVIFRMPFMVSPMAYIVDSTESNGIKCENCKEIVTLEMKRCPHCHFALSPPSKSDIGFPSKPTEIPLGLIAAISVLFTPLGAILIPFACASREYDGWDILIGVIVPGFGLVKSIACLV